MRIKRNGYMLNQSFRMITLQLLDISVTAEIYQNDLTLLNLWWKIDETVSEREGERENIMSLKKPMALSLKSHKPIYKCDTTNAWHMTHDLQTILEKCKHSGARQTIHFTRRLLYMYCKTLSKALGFAPFFPSSTNVRVVWVRIRSPIVYIYTHTHKVTQEF